MCNKVLGTAYLDVFRVEKRTIGGPMLTNADVRKAYKAILNGEPESESIIEHQKQSHDTASDLIHSLKTSHEYKASYPNRRAIRCESADSPIRERNKELSQQSSSEHKSYASTFDSSSLFHKFSIQAPPR